MSAERPQTPIRQHSGAQKKGLHFFAGPLRTCGPSLCVCGCELLDHCKLRPEVPAILGVLVANRMHASTVLWSQQLPLCHIPG